MSKYALGGRSGWDDERVKEVHEMVFSGKIRQVAPTEWRNLMFVEGLG